MIRELTRPGKCLLAGVVGNIKGHCEPICLRVALKIRKCLVLLNSFFCQVQFLHLVVPVISRHQRLPRLWLDPVKWWAIGFSFQLAINQQSVCTSSAWLLPPGQGRLSSCTSGYKIVLIGQVSCGQQAIIFGQKCAKAYNTRSSRVVTYLSTIQARRCLTSEIGWVPVLSTWYGRKRLRR